MMAPTTRKIADLPNDGLHEFRVVAKPSMCKSRTIVWIAHLSEIDALKTKDAKIKIMRLDDKVVHKEGGGET